MLTAAVLFFAIITIAPVVSAGSSTFVVVVRGVLPAPQLLLNGKTHSIGGESQKALLDFSWCRATRRHNMLLIDQANPPNVLSMQKKGKTVGMQF
jgi:hypothetical protein